MDDRTEAKRSIESSTQRLTDIAQELSRRATPRYVADQAKETALEKTSQWKEQIGSSPLALGLIGGTIGALIGRALAKERRNGLYGSRPAFADERGVRYGRGLDVRIPYGSDAGWTDRADGLGDRSDGMGQKLAGTAHDLKDKAGGLVANVRDSAGDVVSNVRDHLPTVAQMHHTADENPMMVALGGLVLGAAAALLLPVSRKERELLEPVKQKAGEAIGSLGDKIDGGMQQAREKLAGDPPRAEISAVPSLTH